MEIIKKKYIAPIVENIHCDTRSICFNSVHNTTYDGQDDETIEKGGEGSNNPNAKVNNSPIDDWDTLSNSWE